MNSFKIPIGNIWTLPTPPLEWTFENYHHYLIHLENFRMNTISKEEILNSTQISLHYVLDFTFGNEFDFPDIVLSDPKVPKLTSEKIILECFKVIPNVFIQFRFVWMNNDYELKVLILLTPKFKFTLNKKDEIIIIKNLLEYYKEKIGYTNFHFKEIHWTEPYTSQQINYKKMKN